MLQKIVITGGPCSGKTTLINKLFENGFEIIPETTREILEEEMKLASCFPWRDNHNWSFRNRPKATLPWKNEKEFIKFEDNVFQAQLNKEHIYEQRKKEGQVFLDRSLIDIPGYCSAKGLPTPVEIINAISKANYSFAIFLATIPEETYKRDQIRQESYQDALTISSYILDAYKNTKIPILILPVMENEQRIDIIERHIIKPYMT